MIVTWHPSLLALGYLPQSEFARVALAYGAWLRSIGSVEGQLSDRTYRLRWSGDGFVGDTPSGLTTKVSGAALRRPSE